MGGVSVETELAEISTKPKNTPRYVRNWRRSILLAERTMELLTGLASPLAAAHTTKPRRVRHTAKASSTIEISASRRPRRQREYLVAGSYSARSGHHNISSFCPRGDWKCQFRVGVYRICSHLDPAHCNVFRLNQSRSGKDHLRPRCAVNGTEAGDLRRHLEDLFAKQRS